MHELRRTVRFCINPGDAPTTPGSTRAVNGYGGHPPMRGLGRFYEVEVCLRGEPDGQTGYLMNIKEIDRQVREVVIPKIASACLEDPGTEASAVLPILLEALREVFTETLESLAWRLTPYYSIEMSTTTPNTVLMKQSFDFCAAHRLHTPSLCDEDNAEVFGKCNNPNYHGHNYRVDTEVRTPAVGEVSHVEIEEIVDRVIIEPYDHKNLNLDTIEFGGEDGVNPSVEHIARVFYELLSSEIRSVCSTAELIAITVWETDRTGCRYPA